MFFEKNRFVGCFGIIVVVCFFFLKKGVFLIKKEVVGLLVFL